MVYQHEMGRKREASPLFMDGDYIGETQGFHQQALFIEGGKHRLTIVDEKGYSRSRSFEVLSKD